MKKIITIELTKKSAEEIFHRVLRKQKPFWQELRNALQDNGEYCMHCGQKIKNNKQ